MGNKPRVRPARLLMHCIRCGRELTSTKSKREGIGQTCKKKSQKSGDQITIYQLMQCTDQKNFSEAVPA